MTKKPIYKSLYFQVIVAIIAGILVGHFFPSGTQVINGVEKYVPGWGELFYPLGQGFIKLIKMIIAPVIFCTVVSGIAGMESMKSVGKTGGVALLYFEIVSTIALLIGLLVINIWKPGVGMNVDPSTLDTSGISKFVESGQQQSTVDFFMHIIPNTVVGAFAEGEILQVLLFALMFGFALHKLGDAGKPVLKFIDQISHVFFNIVNMIMKLAPIGAFGAMAYTIGKYGIGSLAQLAQLIICFYITCLLFIFLVLGTISRLCGFSILKMIRMIREELLIVLGTSSSESVLPRMLKKLEIAGCEKSVVGLVIPTGYSFNLDGTSIYLTMAAIFIAQATNTQLDLMHQVTLLGVLLISSKGAAGVTGSGFIVMAATLSAVGHIPVAGLALILGIDRFMSEARALTNLVGNSLATIVVAKWVGQLDQEKLNFALANPEEVDRQMAVEENAHA
ncbi:dicarboxylate/amino acid:cation symporter [Acinetobacter johnsonii]|jgi:aerobic C4-dicarboxylate transport protein|uniref:C4-dicarboxylate transport protein n=1 Tax=Acinetobacter johnsonii TaxID=40214 RepID=A0AA42XDZ5_ACIJO|nr:MULTISPECIES: dicarboxylate/amino acid:cation symporter [Acinetobacter]MDN5542664.1 dicarboxylate/amino acid:cation symporter [Acinetobacter sp.]OHC22220.1 MAG: C4-dicarboxylate transporter [Pseudomonadales bacterium RIFCSPHIGHO2_12_FULL_40_16]MCF7641087.1 dicarboxylate/amino acid:cation symporter [Acinetobacter johnsonii]MDH0711736.1 dicarboxylate/amino acid:cation symporter [Acinetobacter johnsonii]MDH0834511.1 dicarboxylate/amino acid:cation symporter [Acinetobacter johnsonii]